MDFDAILTEAHAAADKAQEGMVDNPYTLDCGFAWVTISGTEALARHCRAELKKGTIHNKRSFYGSKGYPSGWQFWGPGNTCSQSISIKEAGAKAFRDVLTRYNIRADIGSRYD